MAGSSRSSPWLYFLCSTRAAAGFHSHSLLAGPRHACGPVIEAILLNDDPPLIESYIHGGPRSSLVRRVTIDAHPAPRLSRVMIDPSHFADILMCVLANSLWLVAEENITLVILKGAVVLFSHISQHYRREEEAFCTRVAPMT